MSKHKRRSLAWVIYYVVIAYLLLLKTYIFFSPSEKIYFYYNCLIAFDPLLYWTYGCALLQVILGLGSIIALTLYSSRTVWGPVRLWQTLFIAKLFFDATGHSYQWNEIVAVGQFAPKYITAYFLILFLLYLPLYYACYIYAFHQDRLNPSVKSS